MSQLIWLFDRHICHLFIGFNRLYVASNSIKTLKNQCIHCFGYGRKQYLLLFYKIAAVGAQEYD